MRAWTIPLIFLAIIIASSCLFTVREDQTALVLNFGRIERKDLKPGLHARIPFIHDVRKFDRRLLANEVPQERYLTGEKKHVLVDSVIRWRIRDVALYFQATRGDETAANSRISQLVKERLRDEFNQRTLQQVVSSERDNMISGVLKSTGESTKSLGIEIVDVRIKRIELPTEVSGSVFDRMSSERKQVAEGLRAAGEKQANTIRATAEKRSNVLLAEAENKAQVIRGEGDAKAAEIYAKAYSADPEFYAFHRSLEAYRKSFADQGNMLVLDPKSDFFKYFEQRNATK
jgi:modulator of FtsH protease HflC